MSRINFHIKNHPTLVAVIVLEHVVQFARRERRHLVRIAVRIPDAGAFDLDALEADLQFRFTTEADRFTALDAEEPVQVDTGEVAYASGLGGSLEWCPCAGRSQCPVSPSGAGPARGFQSVWCVHETLPYFH